MLKEDVEEEGGDFGKVIFKEIRDETITGMCLG